ncbi:Eco57I restriction-modification methylase domain-containing protein [Treponema denticola]|uniref:Eco57I restriction-modification methylase domain-containing protein n=1 Tax=Treponema denticola TaxID=158 RepID=UPI0021080313|nr:TaqI-like C-terminal specificity domain-containing protein [Treponema denticola]UTY24449.1 restriction endonuclease subunit R [Treponema denticola]
MNVLDEHIIGLTKLTELFEKNKKQYNTSAYDEANTRTDFIDKFFELLGWDIRNEQGYSEQYREVVREDKVTIGGKVKAPDYAFRIGGVRKFFVEAKKPSVNIKDELEPAFQVRRYGYTAKLPLCILTDFEEFAVYDTRIKPSPSDKPSAARIFYCTFDEYHKNFDFIFNTFSKEAILKGDFGSYVQEKKGKGAATEVDKELLKLIESWRTDIAKNIALRNPLLSIYHLNTAVQKIIDRIIFLRIAEDKEMEEYGLLKKITESGAVYQKLQGVFDKADVKYNSGLFKPHDWLRSLIIDDGVLSSIINGLYYPECPYEFSILPVEILGNIYEQFLGKTIKFRNIGGRVSSDRTNTRHTAVIEEKSEVKKAGGVYYTPQYIVRYIVENTLGVKIKGQSPDAVAKLKVVDPACGSGSFLVEAYQQLLNYHLDYYSNEKERKQALKNSRIYETGKNIYKLTIEEKQRILLNNIYGVDIDSQAVEVTKLSLYLKLLENEGSETQGLLFKFSDLTLLPSLDSNIKCGNSLVGSDYYNEKDLSLFDDEAMRKINTFDWDKEFLEVFAQGGFDCVIGNPPYVFARESGEKGMGDDDKLYYYSKYQTAKYQINLYHLFIEKGCLLLKDNGIFSYIIPNNWLTVNSNKDLREFILQKANISILNFKYKVFEGADVDTCILKFENSKNNKTISLLECIEKGEYKLISKTETDVFFATKEYIINIDLFKRSEFIALINKIEQNTCELKNYAEVKAGLQAYEVGKGIPKQTKNMKDKRVYHSQEKQNDDYYRYLDGNDVKRYSITWENREYLKYGKHLAAPRNNWDLFSSPRILVRQIPSKPPYCINACYTESVMLNDRNSMNIIYIKFNPKFLLGLLNSRLMSFWFEHKFGKLSRGIFPQFKINELASFPIPCSTEEQQSRLITLVDQMLETQSRLQQAFSDEDKKLLEQRAAIIDKQIDNMVYKLYGLTEDEVKIVEGSKSE